MNTLTQKDKLALQVSLALVAGMFSLVPVAQGAPVLEKVVTGGATVHQSDDKTMTAVVPGNTSGVSNNVINWKDYSIGQNEKVIFDAHDEAGSSWTKTNNYLNVVTGNGTSYIDGAMKGGNNVYVVNPNGVIMGEHADIDVGNLYVSTKKLNPDNYVGTTLEGASVLGNTDPQAEVVNMGKIQANSVYAEGTSIRFYNTKDVQYKPITDVSDTSNINLLPLSSTSNATKNSGVKLKGTEYVHVGYEAAVEATSMAQTADASGQYYAPDKTYAASTLGYVINGSAYNFGNGVNKYDYALVRNAHELQNTNSNKSINYMVSLKGKDTDTIDLAYGYSGGFTPIGTANTDSEGNIFEGNPFTGGFDGNYYKIKNLTVVNGFAGLFGYTKDAKIRNVGIEDPQVLGGTSTSAGVGYAGALVGYADNTSIENVYSKRKDKTRKLSFIGGCPHVVSTTVGDVTTKETVYTATGVGGIIGTATNNTKVYSVYNEVDVYNGGGIVGQLNNSNIVAAYNTGGLVNRVNKDSAVETKHFGIVDSYSGNSKVTDVYNTGIFVSKYTGGDIFTGSVAELSPSSGIVTNGYNVSTTYSDAEGTKTIIIPVGTNNAVDPDSTDGLKAKSYGFFSADENGNAKQSNDTWRIYDDHSLPLLRSFLRANGNGTIPVSFDLNLYADKETNTQPANNTPIKYNSNDVVYNGYYIGASNVKSDSSRNITSGIEAGNGRIKNAGESATLFYSTSQDGYDIADSTINIVKRNLVPPYDMTISKVYDGTAVATDEMRAAFGASGSAIDVADVYNRTGVLVETGLVKSFGVTPENVTLSGNAIQSATYYKSGTDSSNSANWVVNVSQAPDKEHAVPVNVKWNDSVAIDTSNQTKTDGITLDHKNYDFDVTDFKNGTNTVSGYITPRPVYVQLQTPDGIDKVYDSTDNVVYKESGWASAASNVQNVSADAGVALGLSDYGVVASDNATLSVANPYYTTGDGTGTVPNAGTGYTANYPVTLTSTNTGFEAGNYAIYTYTPASGTGDSVTPASPVILNTDNNGNFLMMGTGKINTRTVSTTSAEFWYKDADGNLHAPANTKIYDNSSAYNGSVFVGENQNGANYVDFGVGGAYIIPEDAVAHAGEEAYSKGIISVDAEKFHFALDPTQTKFYNEAKTDSADEATGANAPSGNDVDKRAKYIRYAVTVNGDADVLNNYNMIDENGDPVSMTSSTENPYISFYKEGRIEKRPVYLTLNQSAGINKQYNGDAGLVDTANRVYGAHTDANANGNVTYDASASTDYKKLDDGTSWSVKAAYQRTGDEETAAKDVRKENGVVYDDHKAINYDVSLIGDKADDYILYVGNNAYDQAAENNAARLEATGKITPVKISKVVFGDVNKSYDKTTVVGIPATETGSVQAANYITIADVTDGNSTNVGENNTGTSVLVGNETLKDVFPGYELVTITDLNGNPKQVLKYTGDKIKGNYGNKTSYETNADVVNKNIFSTEDGQHANAAGTSTTGAVRHVQYNIKNGLDISDNYEITNAVQYGKGRIDPLTITSLTYGQNLDNKIAATEKVYDGNFNVVGGYKVGYSDSNGKVTSATPLDDTVAHTSIGQKLWGSNTGLGITEIPLDYTINNGSYFADASGDPTANATGGDNGAAKAVYKLTVDSDTNGDFVLGTAVHDTYKISPGAAEISGEGVIKKRRVYTDDVKQSKTYDGNEFITATGESVLRMNGGGETEQVTGLLSGATNASTAVYSADAGDGYRVHDANAYVDYDATTNADAHFRSLDDKTVTFTPTITTGTGDNPVDVTGNYEFFHNGAVVNGDTIDTTGHAIKQRDLAVTFDTVEKFYDGNDYVKNTDEHEVTLTSTGKGDPVYSAGLVTYNGNLTGAGYAGKDVVNITTQDTSQFLPLGEDDPLSSTYANSTNKPYHDVRYDLIVSGDQYRNYRLVDGSTTPNALTLVTDGNNNVTATGYGKGKINQAIVDVAAPDFPEAVTKVYDGNNNVTYDHTASDLAYDSNQAIAKNSSDYVGGLYLGTEQDNNIYDMTGKYSVLGALYGDTNDSGIKVGDHKFTYTFKITDPVFINNVNLTGLQDYAYNSSDNTVTFTWTSPNATGSITPKNVYASLSPAGQEANPTKSYDGNPSVTGLSADTAKTYVSIPGLKTVDNNGLISVDNTYTVTPVKYQNKNVATENGQVVTEKNYINYQVGGISDNYKLYVDDGNGGFSDTNDILVGKGTITPKEITFNPGKATKVYDATADVNFATNDPTLGFEGLVTGDSLTVATTGDNAIAGKYGNFDGTTFMENANVAFVSDTSDEVADKAVRYTNVWSATSGTGDTLKTNYVLGGANYSSDNGGTVTFAADDAKGRINKVGVSGITANVTNTVSKVYDGTGDFVYDHTAEQGYIGDQIKKVTNAEDVVNSNIQLTLTAGGTLNLDYGYTINEDGTHFDFVNKGTGNVTYDFTVGRDVIRSFDLSDDLRNALSEGTYNFTKQFGGNSITAKDVQITQSAVGAAANPTKEYDGGLEVIGKSKDNGADVDAAKAKTYVNATKNGFINGDTFTVSAAYTGKDVIVNDAGEVQSGQHEINYTVGTDSNNYRLVDADGNSNDNNKVILTGKGTIDKRRVTLDSDVATKTYDQMANVKLTNADPKFENGDVVPKLRIATGVDNETINVNVTSGTYGEYAGDKFKANPNVAVDANGNAINQKGVKYSGVTIEAGDGTDLKNYKLVDGDAVNKGEGEWYFAPDKGKGLITKRTITKADAEITGPVTKVYDGTESLIYDHTDYEDPDQQKKVESITTVGGVTLGGYTIGADDYSVDPDKTHYIGAGVGNGTKDISYALKVGSNVIRNYNPIDFGETNADGSFTFTKVSGNNTIEQKTVYASLIDNLNPTKEYDGKEVVLGKAKNNDKGAVINDAKDLVSIPGLVQGDDGYTVSPEYQQADVVVGDDKNTKVGGNKINYTVSGLSDNYKLLTKDAEGNISNDKVLVGDGTIKQKKLTLEVGLAQKAYDAKSDVNLQAVESSTADDKYPTFTVTGYVDGQERSLDTTKIAGTYGIYNPDAAEAEKKFTADPNVNGDEDFKDVQYRNVRDSLQADTLVTNYKLSSDAAGGVYDETDDTLTFTAEQEKGKITKRTINTLTHAINPISKQYDATNAIYDPNDSTVGLSQDEAKQGFTLKGVSVIDEDHSIEVPIGYNLMEAGFGTLNDAGNAVADTFKDANEDGTPYSVYYKIDGISMEDANRNFKLAPDFSDEGYKGYFGADEKGTIFRRVLSGKSTGALQEKIYDGDNGADVTKNGTDYFNIDGDDLKVLKDDGKLDEIEVSAAYTDEKANIDPKPYEEAKGGKTINYTIKWKDDKARDNYTFADGNGGTFTDGTVAKDYQSNGDIRRREVYVVDKGGDVVNKTYNGKDNLTLPTNADPASRFELEGEDEKNETGVIKKDREKGVDLDKAINGSYLSGEVVRDNGKVVNTAVKYENFGLTDDDDNNYYLTVKNDTGTAPLDKDGVETTNVIYNHDDKGKITDIIEETGGKIDPKKIYISVEKSPTKVYDGTESVTGSYVDDNGKKVAYASASNLTAAADGAKVQRSFGNVNNIITFKPGGDMEDFDVTLVEDDEHKTEYIDTTTSDGRTVKAKDVSRKDGAVQQDKATTYHLSWTNGNYDLESEPASAEAGKQADTFAADGTNGYTDGSGKRTGVLKDYGGEITPKTISVASMDTSKTYSGKEGYVVANPQVNAEIEGIIAKDMPGNGNVQDFLGLMVGKATYGDPTQTAIDEARAENAPKNKKATADEIAEAKPWDAAFNRTADPFQHQVAYSGIAITNGNYELADDEFDGTGTINRAEVTAHPKSATIKAGEAMPSFKGTLDGFMDGETMPKTFYTTVENEDGTTTTTSETRQVPLSEYYNDPEFIYWGPEDGVTNRTEGTNPVYGWYLRKEVGEDKDGNEVVSYYKEKEANLDKNYTLVQAEEPSTLVVEPAPRSGGGGGSGSIVSPPVRESTPVYTTPSVPTPAAPQPQPVLEVGYVEKPVVADSSVYQNVSKDTSNSANPEAQAAIQYGRKGAGIAAGNDDSGKSSTIAIELAEVVNLLGGDVASDGSMSLTNTDSGRKLSVGSTEEGYLSVGAERKEGSIGIETEGENILEEMAAKEGSIGIESEEAQAEVRTEDKEGQIELETEEEMLDAEGKKSSISLRSEGRDGESEITYSDGDLSILNSLNADKKKEQKGEEDEEDSEKSESREGEAAIAYNDVA